jgi:hypothetical protein
MREGRRRGRTLALHCFELRGDLYVPLVPPAKNLADG